MLAGAYRFVGRHYLGLFLPFGFNALPTSHLILSTDTNISTALAETVPSKYSVHPAET